MPFNQAKSKDTLLRKRHAFLNIKRNYGVCEVYDDLDYDDDDYDDARQDKLGKSAQMLRERLDKKFSQVFLMMKILTSKSYDDGDENVIVVMMAMTTEG